MEAKSPDDILGFEFDWLARDTDGHFALFSTAGGGYAPMEYLRNTGTHDAAIETILTSPASTRARFAPEVAPGLPNTWREIAERGGYAFDSDANGGPYRLVAAPEVPVRVAQLPASAAVIVDRIVLPQVRFIDMPTTISNELLEHHRFV